MKNPFKPGKKETRAFTFARAASDKKARTVELAFSSEQPYERHWGKEILDHGKKSVRLGRLRAGGPLLVDHDTRDPVGVIESVRIDTDLVGRAVVRFGRSARAEEIFQDVLDGIRRNVSVSYIIHSAVEAKAGDDYSLPTYRITDWEPLEISLVSVPADATVGVGRGAEHPPITHPILNKEHQTMQDNQVKAEKERVSDILTIGSDCKQMELATEAVRLGTDVPTFQRQVLQAMKNDTIVFGQIRNYGSGARSTDNILGDPNLGFRSFGDFVNSIIKSNGKGARTLDERLARAASAFASSDDGSGGGYGIPPGFRG